ncbi:hypothetical protein COLO4_27240 [Corchorus olitorius]|uniref:Uncharacterized protein n=1 Tax=Corchorus olitorius TaxID=93759 RepID=A0A1R3HRV3_9ROSI|nr:hypothetical protein COLO4_27240 [Corchorus olitorius]
MALTSVTFATAIIQVENPAFLKERHANFKKKEAEHLEEANHLSDERSKIDKNAAHILALITRKWASDFDNLSMNFSSYEDIMEDGENVATPEDDELEANLAKDANRNARNEGNRQRIKTTKQRYNSQGTHQQQAQAHKIRIKTEHSQGKSFHIL